MLKRIWIISLAMLVGCSGMQPVNPAPANPSCKDVIQKCEAVIDAQKHELQVCHEHVQQCEDARSKDSSFWLSPEVTAIGGFIAGVLASIGIWRAAK